MRRTLFFCLVLAALLAGCSNYVRKADFSPMPEVPLDAAPVPIMLRDVELLLPVGTDVGFETSGARFCGWPRYPVSRTVLRNAADEKFLKQGFHDVLEAQGYDVVGSLDIAYDAEDEIERAEYSITAKIRDVQLEMCHKEPDNIMIFFTTRGGTQGEFFMDVDWTVYDALRRKVVYKARTEGYTERRIPNQEGLALMFNEAFEMAAHNLGADRGFYDLLVTGVQPQGWRREQITDVPAERPRLFEADETVTLENRPLSREPFTKNTDRKRKAAVMIQKFGHGSGFFITEEGHILTNAHVVGDAQRMRIVTADKDEALIAEVLRVNKARDVALLRLENIPEGLEIVTLPVRTQWPAVGEDVYAIGVPKDSRKLQDTVTKGIVSAHRHDMRFLGVRQNFLQADVEVHPGSSGGPLLDAQGNVVGISVGAYVDANENGIGLNYFIPVAEALKALGIDNSRQNGEPVPLTKKQ